MGNRADEQSPERKIKMRAKPDGPVSWTAATAQLLEVVGALLWVVAVIMLLYLFVEAGSGQDQSGKVTALAAL